MDEYRLNMLPPEFLRPAAWINSGEVEFESLLFTVQNNTTQVRRINSLLLFPVAVVVVQLNIIQAPDKLLFNVFQCRGRWGELDIYLKNILRRREILNRHNRPTDEMQVAEQQYAVDCGVAKYQRRRYFYPIKLHF